MTKPTNSEVQALLRQFFPAFVEKVFQALHPGRTFEDNWHIHAICYQLQQVANGNERRLMINVPPRMLKSVIVSIAWVAFLLGHNPGLSIAVVSHNNELAFDLSAKFRKIVDSDWYKAVFPTMSGAPQKDNERNFVTSAGGGRASVSTHGSVTGRGFDIIILDDPHDAAEATLQTACERVTRWYDNSLSTRLMDPGKSAIVNVMQRLSVFDLAAHVGEQERWARLIIPAAAERDTRYQIGPDEYYVFEQGQLLDPERLSQDFLDTQRKRMGEAAYLAQYQQQPVPAGGGEIDIGLFQRYNTLPREYDAKFLSIDAATGSQSGSYSVIQLYQVTDGRLYLCANYRGFWNFPTLVNQVRSAQEKSAADFVVIEKASSGTALLEVLWDAYPPEIRTKLIQKWSPRHPKDVRMSKAMVTVAAGKVLLPENAPWLDVLIPELRAFPAGVNDDQVDALSQAVEFFNRYLKSRYNPKFKGGGRVIAAW
ncbi:phage terminase large subunit [Aestuariicoccus sp. MJ-SS9]|uniref:phage terminase large subunit n=1 Tax=Aestuariicoccus sp. MJ-SS9 TaxID=3079855 RepID=UPI00290B11B9|nr:phage terminase large subunit [Aestuariicoccus sp. MJ-SS9]MDU8912499.1 phage terminase large subunit [Aestuariicoccus sp. MJ-SS9]